jgi:hypothetical protein
MDSRELAEGSLTLAQRKGARQRNKPPIKQHSKKPNSKEGQWWLQSCSPEPEDNIQAQTTTPH